MSAMDRAHPSYEFADLEWLDEIIVRSEVQSSDAIVEPVPGGDDEHGNTVASSSCRLEYRQARGSGKTEIQQYDGMSACRQRLMPVAPSPHPVDGHTLSFKGLDQASADHRVVFDEEHAQFFTCPRMTLWQRRLVLVARQSAWESSGNQHDDL
jgi:hypothetical protein